jgi:hypothetical protein
MMALGGLVSLSDRRWRVGIATRRRLPGELQPLVRQLDRS